MGRIRSKQTSATPEDRAALVFGPDRVREVNPAGYGFHYQPYNFDSKPEVSYFDRLLVALNGEPSRIIDVYFIGALTSPAKTDITFDYVRKDGSESLLTGLPTSV